MATVRTICPYCGNLDRLAVTAPIQITEERYRRPWLSSAPTGKFSADIVCAANCHICGGWVIALFSAWDQTNFSELKGGVGDGNAVENSGLLDFLKVYPSYAGAVIPNSVPKSAAEFYREADDDLRVGRNSAGIIGKCRSVLDLCLKELGAEGKGRKQRISDLKHRGLLTTSIADWADRRWEDGNDAIHDLTGDAEKARQHVNFLKLFFEVAFQLPAQVSAAQHPPPDSNG